MNNYREILSCVLLQKQACEVCKDKDQVNSGQLKNQCLTVMDGKRRGDTG
jgi:hypothetical protein